MHDGSYWVSFVAIIGPCRADKCFGGFAKNIHFVELGFIIERTSVCGHYFVVDDFLVRALSNIFEVLFCYCCQRMLKVVVVVVVFFRVFMYDFVVAEWICWIVVCGVV